DSRRGVGDDGVTEGARELADGRRQIIPRVARTADDHATRPLRQRAGGFAHVRDPPRGCVPRGGRVTYGGQGSGNGGERLAKGSGQVGGAGVLRRPGDRGGEVRW